MRRTFDKHAFDNASGVDDGDWFGIAPALTAGEATIPGTEVYYLGVDTSGKVGPVDFTFDFIYQNGETGPTGRFDDSPADGDIESWFDVVATDIGWAPFFFDGPTTTTTS